MENIYNKLEQSKSGYLDNFAQTSEKFEKTVDGLITTIKESNDLQFSIDTKFYNSVNRYISTLNSNTDKLLVKGENTSKSETVKSIQEFRPVITQTVVNPAVIQKETITELVELIQNNGKQYAEILKKISGNTQSSDINKQQSQPLEPKTSEYKLVTSNIDRQQPKSVTSDIDKQQPKSVISNIDRQQYITINNYQISNDQPSKQINENLNSEKKSQSLAQQGQSIVQQQPQLKYKFNEQNFKVKGTNDKEALKPTLSVNPRLSLGQHR